MKQTYRAPTCPDCGSLPLLDWPSSFASFYCPKCGRFWSVDLAPVARPRSGDDEVPVSSSRRPRTRTALPVAVEGAG